VGGGSRPPSERPLGAVGPAGRLVEPEPVGYVVGQIDSNALHTAAQDQSDDPSHDEHDPTKDCDDKGQGKLGLVGARLYQNVPLHQVVTESVEVPVCSTTPPDFHSTENNHGWREDNGGQEDHQSEASCPTSRIIADTHREDSSEENGDRRPYSGGDPSPNVGLLGPRTVGGSPFCPGVTICLLCKDNICYAQGQGRCRQEGQDGPINLEHASIEYYGLWICLHVGIV